MLPQALKNAQPVTGAARLGKIQQGSGLLLPSDNCLFVVNTDQAHTLGDKIGSACEGQNKNLSLYIKVGKIAGSAPLKTTFDAISEGDHKTISRDL